MNLENSTKIKFGNAYHLMWYHEHECEECCHYLHSGDGDLCAKGKEIICGELAFMPTNDRGQRQS